MDVLILHIVDVDPAHSEVIFVVSYIPQMLQHSRFIPPIHVSPIYSTLSKGKIHHVPSHRCLPRNTLLPSPNEGSTQIFNHLDQVFGETKDLGLKVFYTSNDRPYKLNPPSIGKHL